jgi:Fe-S-cluster-containing hydrogenase component 2
MKKILIDLVKLRDYQSCEEDAVYHSPEFAGGLLSLREEATFALTCRKCKDSPCIAVCPSGALEKNGDGRLSRNVNLCVRCKSCVTICPFGTIMPDLFDKKTPSKFYNLNDNRELDLFLKACPKDSVMLYEGDEDPSKHIFKLNEKVMIREYTWNT